MFPTSSSCSHQGIYRRPTMPTASDLMVEIVSPNDSASDLVDKVEFYLQNGVRSVWIVDPSRRRIDIYKPGRGRRRDHPRRELSRPKHPVGRPFAAGFPGEDLEDRR